MHFGRRLVRGPFAVTDETFFVVSRTVFIRIRNSKPWYHLPMCTIVLWTKIVVEFSSDKETVGDRQTDMRCEPRYVIKMFLARLRECLRILYF